MPLRSGSEALAIGERMGCDRRTIVAARGKPAAMSGPPGGSAGWSMLAQPHWRGSGQSPRDELIRSLNRLLDQTITDCERDHCGDPSAGVPTRSVETFVDQNRVEVSAFRSFVESCPCGGHRGGACPLSPDQPIARAATRPRGPNASGPRPCSSRGCVFSRSRRDFARR
jgi:hypothetical protein